MTALPNPPSALFFDFDGVFTDNRVWVFEDGREAVACNRSDGHGLSLIRPLGIPMIVLSTEKNPVVAARCGKLGLACRQGLSDKGRALEVVAKEESIDLSRAVYVGNDLNDMGCLQRVGFPVAVADAYPEVRAIAALVLSKPGGHGAVRELCDLIRRQIMGEGHAAW